MKRALIHLFVAVLVSMTTVCFMADLVGADPISVQRLFHFRDNRGANNVGLEVGDRLTYGAQDVIPDGYGGTTGTATQSGVTTTLKFDPYSTSPNQFDYAYVYRPLLTGAWTLNFQNGPDTTTVQTPSVGAAAKLPFATSARMSGSGLTPTFSWMFPADYTPDGVRVQIWDLERRLPSGIADNIHSVPLPGDTTSYTLPATLSSGKALEEGHRYSLEVTFATTRNGGPVGNNTTILSRSRSFLNFALLPAGSPADVLLPEVTGDQQGAFTFNADVIGGETIFIDPVVAVGYDYAIGAGNPNFASVTLPTGIGDNLYSLYLFNGTKYVLKAWLKGGVPYKFRSGGVDRFRVLGIEKAAGLDPNNATAFITGLTFTGSGKFTGTMTALTESFVPNAAGGGWIQSPAGAYTQDPSLKGPAEFLFSASWKKGATVPQGGTEFLFGAGRFVFHSDAYEWLEVNQARTNAQFKGTGAINGVSGYGFMIWTGDKSKEGGVDTFRIRIWETATQKPFYDNGTDEEIRWGSIKVYAK